MWKRQNTDIWKGLEDSRIKEYYRKGEERLKEMKDREKGYEPLSIAYGPAIVMGCKH